MSMHYNGKLCNITLISIEYQKLKHQVFQSCLIKDKPLFADKPIFVKDKPILTKDKPILVEDKPLFVDKPLLEYKQTHFC